MNRRSRMRFLGVSVLLHALVLALGWWHSQKTPPAKRARTPVVMELRAPAPRPAEAAQAPALQPPIRKTARAAAQASASARQAPATEAPKDARPAAESFAPREINTGGVVIGMRAEGAERGLAVLENKARAFGDDGLNEQERVQGRLGKEVDAFMVRQHTAHGARGTAATLRGILRESFTPTAAYVDKIPGSSAAIAQVMKNAAEARMRPSAESNMRQALVPSQQEIQRGMGTVDPCAQSHEIGRRECRFHVDHDSDGQAAQVKLVLSSGDPAFDAYAQDVLKRSQSTHLSRNPEEPHPLFSEWALAQVVYDWASTPGCMDPNFRPPGKPVFPDSKTPYAITYTAEVSLLAVRYH